MPAYSHLLLRECIDRAARDFSLCNGPVTHLSFDISVGWMDELAWRRARLGVWKEPLRISFEPYCGESGFAYSWMGNSCSWKMSPTYCVARDTTEIWPWGHSQSQLIRQTIWWSEEIPRKGVRAHPLKCSLPWRREVVVCPRPWDAGEEILPRNRREEKNSEIGWKGGSCRLSLRSLLRGAGRIQRQLACAISKAEQERSCYSGLQNWRGWRCI